jgi:signal transduction histidine kinase
MFSATKYNYHNGKVVVRSCLNDSGSHVRIEVEDTGSDISEQDIEKLFRPFERLLVDDSTVEGTGIGLNISQKLVERMHGHIGVDSRAEQGSVFWIDLPKACV